VICPDNACLASGDHFSAKWTAASANFGSPTCKALNDSIVSFSCNWAGGLVVEPAIYDTSTKKLSCKVPVLPGIPYDSIVALEIDFETDGSEKRITGVYMGMYTALKASVGLEKSQIMVRYVASPQSCGCGALPSYSGLTWYVQIILYAASLYRLRLKSDYIYTIFKVILAKFAEVIAKIKTATETASEQPTSIHVKNALGGKQEFTRVISAILALSI
jgi:hypothetical protein